MGFVRLACLALLALCCLGAASAGQAHAIATPKPVDKAPARQMRQVKIGFALSLTGAGAPYGATQKNGALLAVEQLNAKAEETLITLTPVFEDDASSPEQGLGVYAKLINIDAVAAIVGPTLSRTARAADRLAQDAGVPVVAISNTRDGIPDIGDYIFRESLPEEIVIPNTIRVAKEAMGISRAALLCCQGDSFTKTSCEVFKRALTQQGIEIVSEETFAAGDRDFSPQLTRIKTANPDALFVSALVEEASGIVIQARQLDVSERMPIVGNNGFNSPTLIDVAGEAAEGVVVGAAWNSCMNTPDNGRFVAEYHARFGLPPDQFAAQAYAAVQILHQALKQGRATDERKILRDALARTKDVDTVLGKFSFTPSRDAACRPVVQIVKSGKFQVYGGP